MSDTFKLTETYDDVWSIKSWVRAKWVVVVPRKEGEVEVRELQSATTLLNATKSYTLAPLNLPTFTPPLGKPLGESTMLVGLSFWVLHPSLQKSVNREF